MLQNIVKEGSGCASLYFLKVYRTKKSPRNAYEHPVMNLVSCCFLKSDILKLSLELLNFLVHRFRT